MKINLRTDRNLRKLLWISDIFGPPDGLPLSMQQYPNFFGKNVYIGSKIFRLTFDTGEGNNEKGDKIIRQFLNKEIESKEANEVADLLEQLDIPIEKSDNDAFFSDTLAAISQEFNRNEKGIDSLVRKIFGMHLPDKITLILAENLDRGMSVNGGVLLDHDPIALGYTRSYSNLDTAYLVGTILHELLHALIGSRSLTNRKTPEGRYFEEALLDYFCHYGIITEKIGLTKRAPIEKYHERSVRNRPYSEGMSTLLLPLIKDYYAHMNSTVWEILGGNEFDGVLNRRKIKRLLDSTS